VRIIKEGYILLPLFNEHTCPHTFMMLQSAGIFACSFLDSEADGTGSAVAGLDKDGSGDNIALSLTQANVKALGFKLSNTSIRAYFNCSFWLGYCRFIYV
jgi:hypothetical protein